MKAVKYTDIPPVSFIITDRQMLSGGWTGHRVTAAKHIMMSQPGITRERGGGAPSGFGEMKSKLILQMRYKVITNLM